MKLPHLAANSSEGDLNDYDLPELEPTDFRQQFTN